MTNRRRHHGLKLFLTLASATLTAAGAWACPVPHDADSTYHTMSRLKQIAPHLGIKTTGGPVSRDPEDITHCEGGLAGIYPCNNVDLMSFLPLSSIGGGQANDIWGWTDPLNGDEYAIIGKTNGTAFINITVPEHPQYLGTLPTHTSNSSWRDVKTYANHAYIVSEASGHGMQVFDLTELRNVATPRTFTETTHYAEFGAAHNIIINEDTGFAYGVGTRNSSDGCGGGLHMVDISRPAVPEFAGCYSGDGYTHDAQCVVYSGPDTDYQGKEVCFNYNEDTLTIVDVSDKAAPAMIARVPYGGSDYTHQGWLTEDQVFLLLDDEGDELRFGHNTRTFIWDVSDLDDPELMTSYLAPVASIDHNQYIKGNFVYQANYRAGLRILDISNIALGSLVQNGYFDVYPANNNADFDGSWSVFPYFDSGMVIVSGIESGLFVLHPTALDPGFMLATNDENLAVCGDGVSSTFIDVDPVGSYVGTVDLQASGAPVGVTIDFTPPQLAPPGTSIAAAHVSGAAPGVYPITVTAGDGELEFDQPLTLALSQVAPEQPALLIPAANAVNVSGIQTLYWDATPGALTYDLEVATDPGFANIAFSVLGTQQRSYIPPAALATNTTHYWRVTANNACGSVTSAIGSFTTADSQCQTFFSSDVPIAISGTGSFSSALSANATGTIVDVNVIDLQATHSWINDIDVKLEGPFNNHSSGNNRHPERPSVQIMVQSCNNEDNLDINFDDEATPGPIPCPPTDGGTYQPANPLAAFDGSSGTGDWNIVVTDNFVADGGSLDNWGLEICTAPDSLILDDDNDAVDDLLDNCSVMANPAQRDTDNDGFGNMCDGDFNNDGIINFLDLSIMQVDFFQAGIDTDMNGDGIVNFADLSLLRPSFLGRQDRAAWFNDLAGETMNYFVTGGTGFIGSRLVARLLERGGTVWYLTRTDDPQRLAPHLARWGEGAVRAHAVVGDLTAGDLGISAATQRELAGKIDHFFHLAAIYDLSASAEAQRQTNVEGTRNVIGFAGNIKAKRFHHMSSIAAAGLYDGVFREDMFEEATNLNDPYFETKHASEAIVRSECDMPWRVYRPGIVVGDSRNGEMDKIDGPYHFFKAIQKTRSILPQWMPTIGVEGGRINIVPVDFVVNATDHIAHLDGLDGKCFHLTDPEPRRIGEVLNIFSQAAHAPEMALRINARMFGFVPSYVWKGVAAFRPVQRITASVLETFSIPKEMLRFVNYPTRFDCRETLAALEGSGIAVPDLEEYAFRLWDYFERVLDPDLYLDRSLSGRVHDRVVVITGASSGIGKAAALKIGEAGAKLALVARTPEKLEETAAEIAQLGGKAFVYPCDLSDLDACDETMKRIVNDHGHVDILINNAGRSIRRGIENSFDRFHDFERTMQLNYFGALRTTLAALPSMMERHAGQVINISSIGVLSNAPRFSAYVASKAALDAFTRCAAAEFSHLGIHFTTINMPLVRTPMIAPTKLYDNVPTISPEEAAELIVDAVVHRPKRIATRLGIFAEIAHLLAPRATELGMNEAYRLFPDSASAKGKKEKHEPSPEQIALAQFTRGIHW